MLNISRHFYNNHKVFSSFIVFIILVICLYYIGRLYISIYNNSFLNNNIVLASKNSIELFFAYLTTGLIISFNFVLTIFIISRLYNIFIGISHNVDKKIKMTENDMGSTKTELEMEFAAYILILSASSLSLFFLFFG